MDSEALKVENGKLKVGLYNIVIKLPTHNRH